METFVIIACVVASMFSYNVAEVESFVNANDSVISCQAIVVENNIIIACDTKPFFSRTQLLELKNLLQKQVAQRYEFNEVIITVNLMDYHAITKLKQNQVYNGMSPKEFYESVKKRR